MFQTTRQLRSYCAKSKVPVLLDFTAPWCAPCKSMKPVLKKLHARFDERLKIVEIDIDETPGIARAFNVMSIPLLVLVGGKKTLTTLVGAHNFAELERRLEPFIDVEREGK